MQRALSEAAGLRKRLALQTQRMQEDKGRIEELEREQGLHNDRIDALKRVHNTESEAWLARHHADAHQVRVAHEEAQLLRDSSALALRSQRCMEQALEAKKREKSLPRVLEEQRRMREEQRVGLMQKIKAVESQREAFRAEADKVPRLRQEIKTLQHQV
jgi:hypothetical protein